MKFRHCLFVFIVMLLSLAALAQQKSDSNVAVVNTPSPFPAVAADPPKEESTVGRSKAGSSLRPFTPQLLTFDELVELSEQDIPPVPLQQKLNALLTTPFVDNSMSNRGGLPIKPFVAGL